MKWYYSVVLTCISLVANDAASSHVLIVHLIISLEKYLFVSLAHCGVMDYLFFYCLLLFIYSGYKFLIKMYNFKIFSP